MSQFIRQLNIISSLKTGSEGDKILPVYKVIAPVLTFDPSVHHMHTQVVNKSLKLKTQDVVEKNEKPKEKRNLAIVLSWMSAKKIHVDKYCNIYLNKGFDVLAVSITPQQMLFPVSGTQVVATNILDYLETNKRYDKVLVHAFSVGGYLMGEVFTKLKENEGKYSDFTQRIVGMIVDSAVDVEGIPTGFPRAITRNPITLKAIEWYVKTHLSLMYNIATKHYYKASRNFHNTPLKCPALFFVSDSDKIGSSDANRRLANMWKTKGVDISFKCWEKSGHVSHMLYHKDEYLAELNKFLSKLDLYRS